MPTTDGGKCCILAKSAAPAYWPPTATAATPAAASALPRIFDWIAMIGDLEEVDGDAGTGRTSGPSTESDHADGGINRKKRHIASVIHASPLRSCHFSTGS